MIGILIDSDYQPLISSGEIQLGEITPQNQAIIIQCHKGEFKENPALGVGISDMLLDHDPLYWRVRIREALELDGQSVDEVRITTSGINLKASY
jgi:hypothetical protein